MSKTLYSNILPPREMRNACADSTFFVPDTKEGYKVAELLHDRLNTDDREILFKTAAELDTQNLAEAYKKVQERKYTKEDKEEEAEMEETVDDDIYGEDVLVSLDT